MPLSASGPVLAVLFAAGIALNSPGVLLPASCAGAPLLRWAVAALFLLFLGRGRPAPRVTIAGLLALTLGALRGTGLEAPGSGPELPAGPAAVAAWIAEVPVVVPPRPAGAGAGAGAGAEAEPAGGPRTSFRTMDPPLRVAVGGEAPWLEPGQTVLLEGRILPPRRARNPGDRPEPDAGAALWVARPECARPLEYRPLRRPVAGTVLFLRKRAQDLIRALYPQETAGFLTAMLLGDRRLLPDSYRKAMAGTGTIHFLAVSGLNVGMAMALVVRLPLPRRLRLTTRMSFLLVFTLVTGGAPPVVRAAVMLAVHLVGEACGRSPRPLQTLSWSAALILAVEPAWVFDVGFWLSVIAVFAMIAWAPPLAGLPRGMPSAGAAGKRVRGYRAGAPARLAAALLGALWSGGRRSLAVALATSLGTAPIILLVFYRVHPLGPLWNLLVGPIVDAVLLGGGLSLLLGAVHPVLGIPAAWCAHHLSLLLLAVLEQAARVPGSCVYLPPPPAWAALLAQGCLVLGSIPVLRRGALALLALLSTGLFLCAAGNLGGKLGAPAAELVVLDVGSGSCALLRTAGGGNYLFDCGTADRRPGAGERIARAILASGVRRIDGVFLSHPHQDHLSALLELSEILPPGRVWVSPLFGNFPVGSRLLAGLSSRKIAVERAGRGQQIRAGGDFLLELFHPSEGESLRLAQSPNDGSLVARAVLPGCSLLFPGDIEEEGAVRLLAAGDDLRSDLLVLPHHGRTCARLAEILERVRPELILASGDGSGGGRETCERLRQQGFRVAATWEGGAVRVDLGSRKLEVGSRR